LIERSREDLLGGDGMCYHDFMREDERAGLAEVMCCNMQNADVASCQLRFTLITKSKKEVAVMTYAKMLRNASNVIKYVSFIVVPLDAPTA
jgi:hypothetical protein